MVTYVYIYIIYNIYIYTYIYLHTYIYIYVEAYEMLNVQINNKLLSYFYIGVYFRFFQTLELCTYTRCF